MPNFHAYANDFVFTLPQDMQERILNLLTHWHNVSMDYWKRAYHAQNDDAREYCNSYYREYKDKIRTAEQILAAMNIYPVIGWSGHRDKFFFPTVEDCDMEEDWYFQCGE